MIGLGGRHGGSVGSFLCQMRLWMRKQDGVRIGEICCMDFMGGMADVQHREFLRWIICAWGSARYSVFRDCPCL